MQFGFSLPTVMDGDALCRFARTAEALGFESIWAYDHVVLPTAPTTQYPYSSDGSFPRAGSEPFLETMTVLSYVAACTERVRIGSTVIIVPYRNPVVQAKMFASLDVLGGGRAICGVGGRLAREGVRNPGRAVFRTWPDDRRVPGDSSRIFGPKKRAGVSRQVL